MKKEIPIYELVLGEGDKGVYAISFVNRPAMKATMVYFGEDESIAPIYLASEEQQIVVAPVIIPNQLITRADNTGKVFMVYFTGDTSRKAASKAFKMGAFNTINLEHSPINTLYRDEFEPLESWVIDDPTTDKANTIYGYDFPKDTWMVSYKVNDPKIIELIKKGEINGVSLEGGFSRKFDSYMTQDVTKLSQDDFKLEVIKKYWKRFIPDHITSFLEAVSKLEIEKRYKDFHNSVNMTPSQFEDWSNQPCSRRASLDRKPVERLKNLLNTPKEEWGIKEYDEAGKVIAFISRMKGNTAGEPVRGCGMSKKTISLLNWGYDPGVDWRFALPEPQGSETRDEFIGRCMADSKIQSEFRSEDQRAAVCYAQYKETTKMREEGCPIATQDIAVNLANRQQAIDVAHYGPLNPNEPNEEYWKAKAEMFGGDIPEAKKALCGNCAFFNIQKATLDCIAKGIGFETDPYDTIKAGQLGYCEAFDFKCAAARTCDAWVIGGPITDTSK